MRSAAVVLALAATLIAGSAGEEAMEWEGVGGDASPTPPAPRRLALTASARSLASGRPAPSERREKKKKKKGGGGGAFSARAGGAPAPASPHECWLLVLWTSSAGECRALEVPVRAQGGPPSLAAKKSACTRLPPAPLPTSTQPQPPQPLHSPHRQPPDLLHPRLPARDRTLWAPSLDLPHHRGQVRDRRLRRVRPRRRAQRRRPA